MVINGVACQTFRVALLFGDDGTVALFEGARSEIVPRRHMGISLVFDIPNDLLVFDGSRGTFEIATMPNIRLVIDQLHLVIDAGAPE